MAYFPSDGSSPVTFIALGALNPLRRRSGRDWPSPPEAGSFVRSAKRPTARKQLSFHLLELEGRVPPQPVHSPRLPSAIFSFQLLQHPPHIFQGGNRHGWLAPHVGWDRHPNEIRATHQTTAVDLPLLLTVARSAFTGGPRLRRVLLQHMRAHTLMMQLCGTISTRHSMLSLVR